MRMPGCNTLHNITPVEGRVKVSLIFFPRIYRNRSLSGYHSLHSQNAALRGGARHAAAVQRAPRFPAFTPPLTFDVSRKLHWCSTSVARVSQQCSTRIRAVTSTVSLLTFITLFHSPTTDNERWESFLQIQTRCARYTVSKASLEHLGHVVCTRCGRAARFFPSAVSLLFLSSSVLTSPCAGNSSHGRTTRIYICICVRLRDSLIAASQYTRTHNRGLPPATRTFRATLRTARKEGDEYNRKVTCHVCLRMRVYARVYVNVYCSFIYICIYVYTSSAPPFMAICTFSETGRERGIACQWERRLEIGGVREKRVWCVHHGLGAGFVPYMHIRTRVHNSENASDVTMTAVTWASVRRAYVIQPLQQADHYFFRLSRTTRWIKKKKKTSRGRAVSNTLKKKKCCPKIGNLSFFCFFFSRFRAYGLAKSQKSGMSSPRRLSPLMSEQYCNDWCLARALFSSVRVKKNSACKDIK